MKGSGIILKLFLQIGPPARRVRKTLPLSDACSITRDKEIDNEIRPYYVGGGSLKLYLCWLSLPRRCVSIIVHKSKS